MKRQISEKHKKGNVSSEKQIYKKVIKGLYGKEKQQRGSELEAKEQDKITLHSLL